MKRTWLWTSQVAVWLVSLVLLFVVQPPRMVLDDAPGTIERFAQFMLTIVIGIVFALFSTRPRQGNRNSVIASAVLLVIGVMLFGSYLYLTDHWTCGYPGGAMVSGATLLPAAAAYVSANPGLDCSQLMLDFGGQTQMIWPLGELSDRRLILAALFTAVILSFALAALFMIRALLASPPMEMAPEDGQPAATPKV
jgi:hypothetical protein